MRVFGCENVEIKKKIQATEASLKKKIGNVKKDVAFVKEIMATKDVVFFKTDALAILVRKRGEFSKFFKVLDKITKEGYDLKSQEELGDLVPSPFPLAIIYTLQNKKYVNV